MAMSDLINFHRHAVAETIGGTQYVYTYLEKAGDFEAGFACPASGLRFHWLPTTVDAREQLIDWMGTTTRDAQPGEKCPIKHFEELRAKLNAFMIRDLKLAKTEQGGEPVFQPFYVV